MRLKKLGVSFVLSVIALVTPFTSAFAGAGEWDYLGSYNLRKINDTRYESPIVYSGGGNFKVCGYTQKNDIWYLYEYDKTNSDDYIGAMTVVANQESCAVFSVGGYVDADNNKAELYIVSKVAGSVSFYD